MPTGPRLSFFLLVKSIRDPAFISSSFSSPPLLLYPELVTAMDRADSSRLAFIPLFRNISSTHSQPRLCSNLHRSSSDRFFLPSLQILCKSAYLSSLRLDHLPFTMQPKRTNDSFGYILRKKKKKKEVFLFGKKRQEGQ